MTARDRGSLGRWVRLALLVVGLTGAGLVSPTHGQDAASSDARSSDARSSGVGGPPSTAGMRQGEWSDEAVEAFGSLPVQDAGRVKPLSTLLGFRLYAFNGKRSLKVHGDSGLPNAGETLDPVRWGLDVVFFPAQAQRYRSFKVDDGEMLDGLGMERAGRKRRDWYSYQELEPIRERLVQLAGRARATDPQQRTRVERSLLNLNSALALYDSLQYLGPACVLEVGADPSPDALAAFPGRNERGELPIPEALAAFVPAVEKAKDESMDDATFGRLFGTAYLSLNRVRSDEYIQHIPTFLPPPTDDAEAWRNPGMALAVAEIGVDDDPLDAAAAAGISALGAAYAARPDLAGIERHLVELGSVGEGFAKSQGVLEDIQLERSYYRANYFYRALQIFALGMLTAVIGLLAPRARFLWGATWALSIAGLVAVVWGLSVRCILLDRPPVATLYETILFITAGAVAASLFAEKVTGYRLGLAASTVLGFLGMLLAYRWEGREAIGQGDTMGGLVAVLNSNFWLATHVTTVTYGYAAGLLAAFFAHLWIGLRIFEGIRAGGGPLAPAIAKRMRNLGGLVYGTIAFGLVLSTVGTILGGVWANDSWGRFWGWDPKENGALMIVLYQLVIVHARLGGYIKDYGVAVLAVVGGGIIAFSWWHVNQLGVGLHAYGFTDGVVRNLLRYYSFVALFTALSLIAYPLFVKKNRPAQPV